MDAHSVLMPLNKAVEIVREKQGKALLSDEDLLVLTCEEIARTYTRDEKNYS